MPSNLDDLPEPRRSDDELIALVQGKVSDLERQRRRRSRSAVISATLVLLLAVIAVGTVGLGGRGSTDLDATEQPDATVSVATSSSLATDTTVTDPASAVPTSAPSPSADPTTTITAPTTATTPLPPCAATDFPASVTTSKAAYSPGETILITMTLTNVGPECFNAPDALHPDVYDSCLSAYVVDSLGSPGWELSPGVACTTILTMAPIPAGWSRSTSTTWDQTHCPTFDTCSGYEVAPGRYSISVHATFGWTVVTVQPATVTIG